MGFLISYKKSLMVEELLGSKRSQVVNPSSAISQPCALENISHLWKLHFHLLEQEPGLGTPALGQDTLAVETELSMLPDA